MTLINHFAFHSQFQNLRLVPAAKFLQQMNFSWHPFIPGKHAMLRDSMPSIKPGDVIGLSVAMAGSRSIYEHYHLICRGPGNMWHIRCCTGTTSYRLPCDQPAFYWPDQFLVMASDRRALLARGIKSDISPAAQLSADSKHLLPPSFSTTILRATNFSTNF